MIAGALLDRTRPSLALFPTRETNPESHPRETTPRRTKKFDAPIGGVGRDGTAPNGAFPSPSLRESRLTHLRACVASGRRRAYLVSATRRLPSMTKMHRMADKECYYSVLEVSRDADERDIKRAYRRLALASHPDRNPNDPSAEDRFKRIVEANDVLSDPEKRAIYDRYGFEGLEATSGGGAGHDPFSAFSDILRDFVGFGGAREPRDPRAPARGQDLQMTVEVPFEFAVHGGETTVTVPRRKACGECDGTGAAGDAKPMACDACHGVGKIRHFQGFFTVESTCPKCRGRGQVVSNPCRPCNGGGLVRERAKVKVKVPAGVDTGNRLRIRGEGEAGRNDGPHGDLYIVLNVRESDVFLRDAADLHLEFPLPFPTAALGGTVHIPTLNGEQEVRIKAGSQHGDVIPLQGQGLPRVGRSAENGDLYVRLAIHVPTKLSKRQRELVEELAEELGASVRERESGLFDRIKRAFSRSEEKSAPSTEEAT